MLEQTTNIIIAGLGGQGVLTSANIISYTAFLAGFDVISNTFRSPKPDGVNHPSYHS